MTQDAPSTGELVTRLSEQMSTLVRDELALARAEMTEKGKRAGTGAGLLGGGGVLALVGRAEVKRAAPPMPERAKENVQADVETVRNAVREGRHA